MKKNHIVMITGLGSSIPFIGRIWTAWARKLAKRIKDDNKLREKCIVTIVSSDGKGEKKALDLIRRDRDKGMLGKVVILGHSNGFRDGLRMAEALFPETVIHYFGGIDMTLGEFGAKAYGNIKKFDEFHAKLQTADFHKTFPKNRHQLFKIRRGHTAAASDKFVQDTLMKNIRDVFLNN